MTNLILQHFDGELRELDKLSIANIKNYASTINAEYCLIIGKPYNTNLTAACQKMHMISHDFDSYDDVLMLDIDMFAPVNMNENIFDVQGVGLYSDTQKRLHSRISIDYSMLASINAPYWGGAIYKMSKEMRVRLRNVDFHDDAWKLKFNKPYHYEDEGIMHVLAYRAGLSAETAYLPNKWCQCSFLPNPEKAGFVHVRTKITPGGPKREKIQNYNALKDAGVL
jgi:hypothetical protein